LVSTPRVSPRATVQGGRRIQDAIISEKRRASPSRRHRERGTWKQADAFVPALSIRFSFFVFRSSFSFFVCRSSFVVIFFAP